MEPPEPEPKRLTVRSTSLMPVIISDLGEPAEEFPVPPSLAPQPVVESDSESRSGRPPRASREYAMKHKPWLYRKKKITPVDSESDSQTELSPRKPKERKKKVVNVQVSSFNKPGPACSKRQLDFDWEPVTKKRIQQIVENQPTVKLVKVDQQSNEQVDDVPIIKSRVKPIKKVMTKKRRVVEENHEQIHAPVFIAVEDAIVNQDLENSTDKNQSSTDKQQISSIVCRVCAVAGPNRFSLIGAKAERLDIRGQLSKYLNMKVVDDDKLPLYICQICTQTITAFNKFYKRSIAATNRLKAIVAENSGDASSEWERIPWYADNVVAKATASTEYLLEKNKAKSGTPQVKQFFITTNIEKLFGKSSNPPPDKPRTRKVLKNDSDDDVQIITPMSTPTTPKPTTSSDTPQTNLILTPSTIPSSLSNLIFTQSTNSSTPIITHIGSLNPSASKSTPNTPLQARNTILIPIQSPAGTSGNKNRYLIATPQSTVTTAVNSTISSSNIIVAAAGAAGIMTPNTAGKKSSHVAGSTPVLGNVVLVPNINAPIASSNGSTTSKKPDTRIITSPTGHVDFVDLEAIQEGKTSQTLVKVTPPTSIVKPTIQRIIQPQKVVPNKKLVTKIISTLSAPPAPATPTTPPAALPPVPTEEPIEEKSWSRMCFKAPAKEDKYTYVVRMDRKPGEQPYFILTANPTKLTSPPELNRQNVGIICKDVYRAEVAKKKAKDSSGSFSNIGLHSWAQHIVWLKQLTLPGDLAPYLKESADKVLDFGKKTVKPKAPSPKPSLQVIAPKVGTPTMVTKVANPGKGLVMAKVGSPGNMRKTAIPITNVDPNNPQSKLYLIPITTVGKDGHPVQTFQVANVIAQPSPSGTPTKDVKSSIMSVTAPSSSILQNILAKKVVESPKVLTSSTKTDDEVESLNTSDKVSSKESVNRTEIVYRNESDDIFDMECVSENDDDDEEEEDESLGEEEEEESVNLTSSETIIDITETELKDS